MTRFLLIFSLALSASASGVDLSLMTVTPAAVLLILGAAWVGLARILAGKTLVPPQMLKIPAVVSCLVYFALGLLSGLFAESKVIFAKEVIQRAVIILAPLYLFALGPKRPQDLIESLWAYLPVGSFFALAAIAVGFSSGFGRGGVYTLDMHKNAIAADCATVALIAAALLVAANNRWKRLALWGFLVTGVLGTIAAQGRAALVGIVAGLLAQLIAVGAKKRYVACLFAALFVGLGLLAHSLPRDTVEEAFTTRRFSSNETRMRVWSEVWGELSREPLICVGWGHPITIRGEAIYDTANVLLHDWMQMSLAGVGALLLMIYFCIRLPLIDLRSARDKPDLCAIDLAATGIAIARFLHAMLDTFWIGRGPTLTTYAAVGMAVFVHLWLMHYGDQQNKTTIAARLPADRRSTTALRRRTSLNR